MNLLLLETKDIDDLGVARVRDVARLRALRRLSLKPASTVQAGLINGKIGRATVTEVSNGEIAFRLELTQPPPAAPPIDLLMALPRPKMLRRVLRTVSECGVKRLWLINSHRVEKSYWQSPLLKTENWRPYLLDGLAQVRDTVLPEVALEPRFKPFVEDRLPGLCENRELLLADPLASTSCPRAIENPCTLAIGPEGGFTDYERSKLKERGFHAVTLGPRILRVETALTYLLGRLG